MDTLRFVYEGLKAIVDTLRCMKNAGSSKARREVVMWRRLARLFDALADRKKAEDRYGS